MTVDLTRLKTSLPMAADPADQSPPSSKKPRSLLDLPDEIWSHIGKLVIDEMGPSSYRRSANNAFVFSHQPAIIQTCRKLRYELLPYFYSTKMTIAGYALYLQPLKEWLSVMGPDMRRSLKGVGIIIHGGYGFKEIPPRLEAKLGDAWGVDLEIDKESVRRYPRGSMWRQLVTVRFL